jgi:hypothetical protein
VSTVRYKTSLLASCLHNVQGSIDLRKKKGLRIHQLLRIHEQSPQTPLPSLLRLLRARGPRFESASRSRAIGGCQRPDSPSAGQEAALRSAATADPTLFFSLEMSCPQPLTAPSVRPQAAARCKSAPGHRPMRNGLRPPQALLHTERAASGRRQMCHGPRPLPDAKRPQAAAGTPPHRARGLWPPPDVSRPPAAARCETASGRRRCSPHTEPCQPWRGTAQLKTQMGLDGCRDGTGGVFAQRLRETRGNG